MQHSVPRRASGVILVHRGKALPVSASWMRCLHPGWVYFVVEGAGESEPPAARQGCSRMPWGCHSSRISIIWTCACAYSAI